MFADSLCEERERGRQGRDVHPRSLLAPLHAPAVPVSVAGGAGGSPRFGHPGHAQPASLASRPSDSPFLEDHKAPGSGFHCCLLSRSAGVSGRWLG